MSKKVPVCLSIEEELKHHLEEIASDSGFSQTELVNQALELFLWVVWFIKIALGLVEINLMNPSLTIFVEITVC